MPSHILMLRAGYARMVGAGIYELLPLGTKVLHNISRIIREEMDSAGSQEVLMPTFLPSEYFKETGRWDVYGSTLLRLKDRKGGEYHLAPTHEEIITDLVRREVKSYKQLPLNLYQIQLKYRDEPRPRAGLLRCREFIMKDAYSFDESETAAEESYAGMRDAYHRIFGRLGLDYRIVEADSGAIGGNKSAEFQVLAQTGEDKIVACTNCDYAANVEVAETSHESTAQEQPEVEANPLEKVRTPKIKTIADVLSFFGDGLSAADTIKSVVYSAGDEIVIALVRGDHEVNEIKLARHLDVEEVHLATDETVREATGAAPGFVGPVGYGGRIVADPAVLSMSNAISGANENPFHLKGVNPSRDFKAEPASIRLVAAGDPCPSCQTKLELYQGIEGGHIFILGTHYSDKMSASFLGDDGKSRNVVMGCYGIGVSRLIAAIIEQHHDESGIIWPIETAPYQVIITQLGDDDEVTNQATRIYESLKSKSVNVLLDDRNERPGVKFKDADLLGIPIRLTVGARGLKENNIEFKARRNTEATLVKVENAVAQTLTLIAKMRS